MAASAGEARPLEKDVGSEDAVVAEGQWFAVHSKPHKEYLVRSLLAGEGVEVYLPEVWVARPRRDRRERKPFFPGYLFARLDPTNGQMARVRWAPGVCHIVSAGGQPVPVPEEVVTHIRLRLERMGMVQPQEPFRKGERVRVLRGPFEGLEAVFDRRLSPAGRVRVFLTLLGRWVAAELDLGDLLPPG